MASGKTSFVLYTSYVHSVDLLTNEQAGKLFKHILNYVNDLDPKEDDVLVRIAFEPIKQQLKRDLKEWRSERKRRSTAGRLGGIKSGEKRRSKTKQDEAKRSSASKNEANEAVDVFVDVNVNDNVDVVNNNNWDSIKLNFFNGWKWKEKFCTDKKVEMPRLEKLMIEFISDTELKEDYKSLTELRKHFINTFNKNNGAVKHLAEKKTGLGGKSGGFGILNQALGKTE